MARIPSKFLRGFIKFDKVSPMIVNSRISFKSVKSLRRRINTISSKSFTTMSDVDTTPRLPVLQYMTMVTTLRIWQKDSGQILKWYLNALMGPCSHKSTIISKNMKQLMAIWTLHQVSIDYVFWFVASDLKKTVKRLPIVIEFITSSYSGLFKAAIAFCNLGTLSMNWSAFYWCWYISSSYSTDFRS